MINAEQRKAIAREYQSGRLVKLIAYDHGISPQTVSRAAEKEGLALRRPFGRPRPQPHTADPVEVLRLFRTGLDTVSIAARLMTTQADAAGALARARDAERPQ